LVWVTVVALQIFLSTECEFKAWNTAADVAPPLQLQEKYRKQWLTLSLNSPRHCIWVLHTAALSIRKMPTMAGQGTKWSLADFEHNVERSWTQYKRREDKHNINTRDKHRINKEKPTRKAQLKCKVAKQMNDSIKIHARANTCKKGKQQELVMSI